VFSDSYPIIPNLEKFRQMLDEQGKKLLLENEPLYCERFQTCDTLGFTAEQTHKECDPLLSNKLDKYIDLSESFYEVQYYWKRLSETGRLIQVTVPLTSPQIRDSSWFIYNLDFYWHALYGLEDRLIRFFTKFKRMYKSSIHEERKFLDSCIETYNLTKKKGAKLVRDPLAHYRSQGVQGWRLGRDWEAALIREGTEELIEAYDNHYSAHSDFYLGYIRTWIPQKHDALDAIFGKLCTFSLDKLDIS